MRHITKRVGKRSFDGGSAVPPWRRALPPAHWSCVLAFVVLTLSPRSAAAVAVEGSVEDGEGRPVSGVAVRLEGGLSGADAFTVFSDDKGRFRTADLGPVNAEKSQLACRKLGYEPSSATLDTKDGTIQGKCVLRKISNVANQVPPSAWLADFPDEPSTYRTVLLCAPCHQLPPIGAAPRGLLESMKGESQAGRLEFWKGMVDQMRDRALEVGPEGSSLSDPELASVFKEILSYALFTDADKKVLSEALSAHMPVEFDEYPLEKAQALHAPLGVTPETYFKEYALEKKSLVREVMMTPNSPYVWGADVKRNRILRLDPRSGEVKWIPFPYDGPTGPHTIDRDSEGFIWISTIENDMIARMDPQNEEIKVWKWPDGSALHDFAQNHKYEVAFDPDGRFWATLAGKNQLGSFNPKTGEKAFFDMPMLEGENPAHTQIYGGAFSPNGLVWFCQLMGGIGAFNPQTEKVEHYLKYPQGAGPRRPTMSDDGTLYVPLYGAGQLVAVNTETGKEIARYDMPDRKNGPYVVTWDSLRKVVWVGTTQTDVLYKFDPATKKWTEFPFPREEAFIRKLFVHPVSGDVWTTYATIPDYRGPDMVVVLHPGDGIGAESKPRAQQAADHVDAERVSTR